MSKKQKMKIRESVAGRFKITKTGKVIFRGSHVRHLRRKKDRGQVRQQMVPHRLTGKLVKKVKQLMAQ